MTNQNLHKSVLLKEIVKYLNASDSGIYLDATFGAGGYSKAILDANDDNKVISFDRDISVKPIADEFTKEYGERFHFVNSKFSEISNKLPEVTEEKLSGMVFDLGVSSMQLDRAERGFSFNKEAKLDMQMGLNDLSAYEVVNFTKEEELANIIYQYGEERLSRRIAKAIVKARSENPIETTLELADIVKKAKGPQKHNQIHPATKTFQAIRIFINEELDELKKALAASKEVLAQNGRLVVVSFHGLEDKIVKNFIRENSGRVALASRYAPEVRDVAADFKDISKGGIKATIAEIDDNIRARSAILRVAEKL